MCTSSWHKFPQCLAPSGLKLYRSPLFFLDMAADAQPMLIDAAMESHGGTEFNLNPLDEPVPTTRIEADIENPISISNFVQGVLRPAAGVKRTRVLVDMHTNVPEVGALHSVVLPIKNRTLDQLPRGLATTVAAPPDTKEQFLFS